MHPELRSGMTSSPGDPGSHRAASDAQKNYRASPGTPRCLPDASCPPCGTENTPFILESLRPTAELSLSTPVTSLEPRQDLGLPAAQEFIKASPGISRCLPDLSWAPDGTASSLFNFESHGMHPEPSLDMASSPGDPGSHQAASDAQKNYRASPGTPRCLIDTSCLPCGIKTLLTTWRISAP